jgi:hypothetical protein
MPIETTWPCNGAELPLGTTVAVSPTRTEPPLMSLTEVVTWWAPGPMMTICGVLELPARIAQR